MEGKQPRVGGQIIARIMGIEPETTYELDAAINTSSKQVNLLLRPFDYQGKLIKEFEKKFSVLIPENKQNQWVLVSDLLAGKNTYQTPAKCRYLLLYLLVSDKQTVYWDDLFFGLSQ